MSHVKAMYVASDVSFAVGAVAAAVAVGLFVAPRYDSSKAQTAQRYMLDVHPLPSGGFASLAGRF